MDPVIRSRVQSWLTDAVQVDGEMELWRVEWTKLRAWRSYCFVLSSIDEFGPEMSRSRSCRPLGSKEESDMGWWERKEGEK